MATNYFGVRKVKQIIKEIFLPDVVFFDRSYKRYSGYERIRGCNSYCMFSVAFHRYINDNFWLSFNFYDDDCEFLCYSIVFEFTSDLTVIYPDNGNHLIDLMHSEAGFNELVALYKPKDKQS